MKYQYRKIDEDWCPSVEQKEAPMGQLYVNFSPKGIEPLRNVFSVKELKEHYSNTILKGSFKNIGSGPDIWNNVLKK